METQQQKDRVLREIRISDSSSATSWNDEPNESAASCFMEDELLSEAEDSNLTSDKNRDCWRDRQKKAYQRTANESH